MIRHCRECGSTFDGSKAAAFCPGDSCRRDWNNRRQQRGAELYDLFMENRFNRQKAKDAKLWSLMCSLARSYRDADNALRNSRLSWSPDASRRFPLAYSVNGDNR